MSRDKEIRKDLDRQWEELESEVPDVAWALLTREEFLEIMKGFARQNILRQIQTPKTII